MLRDENENSERQHVDESARSLKVAAPRLEKMSAVDH